MKGLSYPYVAMPCEGRCGGEIYFSLVDFCRRFHVDGSKREKYAQFTYMCDDCKTWVDLTEAEVTMAAAIMKAQPLTLNDKSDPS